mmetsp:Transcript_712/g.1511  ORF Transcript_712/g.1511 Transcript_712/m.1511 type:complete len:738 (-) Transcript_712:58-2271(-)
MLSLIKAWYYGRGRGVSEAMPGPAAEAASNERADVTEKQANETNSCVDYSKKPSLYQRIDRYLFPPLKLIVDGTLVPLNSNAKGNESDSRYLKRERRLIGTGLGSVPTAAAGVVSRRASQAASDASANDVPHTPATLPSNEVLLWGADTVDAHYQRIRHVLETARGMHGADGLRAVGFEYRIVHCPLHALGQEEGREQGGIDKNAAADMEDMKRPEHVKRTRSQSDAGVLYGGCGSLRNDNSGSSIPCTSQSSHDHHQMIIVPSHAPSVGDLVESAAIRERKAHGFANSGKKQSMLSGSSETSLSTVFCNSESDDEAEDNADGHDKEKEKEKEKDDVLPVSQRKNTLNTPSEATDNEDILRSNDYDPDHCFECFTRLFHIESNTMLTEENLNRHIAQGDMYDDIARMCQEHAQDLMMEEGDLKWVTICDDSTKGNPVRAIVDADHSQRLGPILLVVTGKGKVRAGIFSRRHILTMGIECSTAIPMVREAKRRKMRVALLDPNARGDQEGMTTFEASVRALFGQKRWNEDDGVEDQGPFTSEYFDPHSHPSPMYVLAHSASGAQLVRYLMDQAHHLLPRIAAIVFTDSTHNIQWTREHESLKRLLESPSCVYIRSANVRDDDNWQTCRAGDAVDTDHRWRRRFGTIQTFWAGTAEHSLMNWTSHNQIWSHFDQHTLPSVYQGVAKLQEAIDESMQDNDEKYRKEGQDHDHDGSISSMASHDSNLPHKKRDRSVEIVTL